MYKRQFYANRYGYSGAGHLSGTESQVSLLQQQRGVQAGIRQSVETPRVAAYHNENPVSAPSRPRLPLDTEQRIPSGNPAEARRVIMASARQARQQPPLPPPWARQGPYIPNDPGPSRPMPKAKAKSKSMARPGRAKPHMVNPFD